MKFYAIPPNKHLDMMDNGDSYFGLAHHYLNNLNYRNHFLNLRKNKPKAFITMDCGAAEDSTVTQDQLLKVVAELKPDEVIAPDVLFDKERTLENFWNFCDQMLLKGFISHTSVFACPQGKTKEEWMECYTEMVTHPLVKCVGLSKIAVPKCWNDATGDTMIGVSRNQCIEEIKRRDLLIKPLHLLGMGEHDEFEFYWENQVPHIRSSDSCYTILAALNGIDFAKGDTTRVPTTNAYFDVVLSDDQKALANSNMNYLKTKYKKV